MNFDAIREREDKKIQRQNQLESLRSEEKSLLNYFHDLLNKWKNSPEYKSKVLELKEKLITELKNFMQEKGFTDIKQTNSEVIVKYGDFVLELEINDDNFFSLRIPSEHKYYGITIEELTNDFQYRGLIIIRDDDGVREFSDLEEDDIELLEKRIETLKKDISLLENKIKHTSAIKLCYHLYDHGGFDLDEQYDSIIEILKRI